MIGKGETRRAVFLPIIILCQIFDLLSGGGKPFLMASLFPFR